MCIKDTPIISIVVPVFNAKKYISRCVESILHQTYGNIQIILINDGSTDGSGEICDTFAEKDSRITVVHQENTGTVIARQRGVEVAKGKYVGFVDADDWIESEMFEFLLSKMQETQSDLVQIQMVGQETDHLDSEIIELREDNRAEIVQHRLFRDGTLMPNLFSKLFITKKLRSAFSKVPVEQQFGEDLLCLLHYLNDCDRICMSSRELYHYQMLDGSVSRKSWTQMCVQTSNLYEAIRKTLESYGQWGICRNGAGAYYRMLLTIYLKQGIRDKNAIERYRLPEVSDLKEKQIVLYGAGRVGTDYYKQIVCNEKHQILAWIDKNPVGSAVQSPECLKELEYDCILIAVAKEEKAKEIHNDLLESGLCDDPSKIIWKEPERLW